MKKKENAGTSFDSSNGRNDACRMRQFRWQGRRKRKNQAKSEGKVYYLNFKPEQADDWVKLAETYTDETGVQVDVQTAASGTYESQLKSEMAKEEAPTLFQVNGPVGLASWKDYCYDLSDSQIYKDISSDDYVLKEGDEVKGIAYVVETIRNYL